MSVPLFAPALHLVPFFLLIRIEHCADLIVCPLVDVHHLRSPVILRKRRVRPQRFHLGLFGFQGVENLGLLIRTQVELLGQHLGALARIELTTPSPVLGVVADGAGDGD